MQPMSGSRATITVMSWLIVFGASWVPVVFIILFFYWWLEQVNTDRRKLLLHTLGTALITRFVFGTILKNFFAKARPDNLLTLIDATGYAFPSGHATFFFSLATSVFIMNKRWGICFYALAAILSISRVLAHVHDYADILSGAVLGIVVALVASRIFRLKSL